MTKNDRVPSLSEIAAHLRSTATLATRQTTPAGSGEAEARPPLASDVEEPTAVSALPSGIAAILRDSRVSIHDELTVVSSSSSADARLLEEPTAASTAAPKAAPTGAPTLEATKVVRRLDRLLGPGRPRWGIAAAVLGGALAALAVVLGLAARGRAPMAAGTPVPSPRIAVVAPVARAVTGAPARSQPQGRATVAPALPETNSPAPAAPAPAPAPVAAASVPRRSPGRPRLHAEDTAKEPGAAAPTPGAAAPTPGAAAPTPADAAPTPAGIGQCQLTVGTFPWSELWIDGADTGQHTPVIGMPVACGRHRLEFRRPDLKINQVENVTLNEGRELRRQYELHGGGLDD